ncbi:MAG: hypothetical protein IJS82_02665 [Paludibacteraceae bacterium]|nr:hypothetical protein [Paludibacteraceae bacterium]
MKKSILLGILVCLSTVAFAQRSMEWYAYWGSNEAGNVIEPQRMVVDNEGNIYVAALFGGTKVAVESKTLNSKSASLKGDAVVIKLSPSKVVLWTYELVDAGNATVADLALDNNGNLIVTGTFTRSIRVGAEVMERLNPDGWWDNGIYVLKLTAAGEAIKAWQISAVGATAGSVVVDSQNNIIIAGLLDGDASFGGAEAEGNEDNTAQLFVAKYSNDGDLIWHNFRDDEGKSVYGRPYLALDAADNIYLASGVSGATTIAGQAVSTTVSNAFLLAMNAAGEEQWMHMIEGDEADAAGGVAVSPIGQVAIAVNHHSGDLRIDDLADVFNNGYAFDAQFAHSAFFAFDLNGEFKWFYDWGYSNGTSGSDAVTYGLRCTDEGVWYATGMMTGRFGGSRLPEEIRTLPNGKNSGVETIDNQWLQHNTNGGHDCFLITLTRGGKLANAIRPGGPQYEDGIDVALSLDKKSIYFLQAINVRDKAPFTCPDNIFDSWTDLDGKGRRSQYTVLNVFCPEAGTNPYTGAYKGVFPSLMLVKYALPEINPNEMPKFTVDAPYSQALSIVAAQGQATLFPLEQSADVEFDGTTVSGTFNSAADRFTGFIAIDSIALPGEITYYEYDNQTHQSIRSNPRTVRYMPIVNGESEEGVESVAEDQKSAGRKMLREGVLYIERNGRRYTAQGAELK